jgi:hypothetical protein
MMMSNTNPRHVIVREVYSSDLQEVKFVKVTRRIVV